MKILYHHRTQYKGVEGVHIRGVIQALKALGHEVYVVSLIEDRGEKPSAGEIDSPATMKQKFFHLFAAYAPNFVFRLAEIFYNFVAYFKIRATLKGQAIDVIYERYAYFNFAGVLAAKVYKKPLILEVNIFTALNDARMLSMGAIASVIEKRVFRASHAIFVISNYLKDQLVQSTGVVADKVHVHPNAFATELLLKNPVLQASLAEKIDDDSVVIAFLGRILPWYKLEELVVVFASIQKKHPQTQLMFIGDGSERPFLEQRLAQLEIANRVIFSGTVSHEQALSLLERCDIGVIPSTNLWGSPMKLFEYMGSGLPVVAPNIGVITEIMADKHHGRLFEYDNFSEFEERLEELVKNRAMRESMGENAKCHILEHHTWQNVGQHVINVAEELLDKP